MIVTCQLDTPLGPMLAGATGQGVCLLEFVDSGRVEPQLRRLAGCLGFKTGPGESPFFATLQAQLDEYFTGLRLHFSLPLVLAGTPFQLRVWIAVQSIPYGETRTYRALAAQIGQPEAARGGERQLRESARHPGSVPPADRRGRQTDRLRGRVVAQTPAAGAGAERVAFSGSL
jgi:AraC family transcriptional regulator of adaptative response/methylated-DNA-[protein]-cysteine methyltransferase